MRDSIFSVRFTHVLFVAAAACTGSSPTETPPDAGMTGSGSDTGSGSGSGSGSDTGSGSGSDTGSGSGSGSAIQPLSCDYTEQDDTTNDFYEDSPGVEATGLTFAGSQQVICGTVNNGHYDAGYGTVDVDNYGFTVLQSANALITLRATAANMNMISSVGFFAVRLDDNGDVVQTIGGYFSGDHGAMSGVLINGNWQIDVEAYDNQDAPISVDYQLAISPDYPAQRCASLFTNPVYVEAHDGADSTGNDVLSYTDGDYDPAMIGNASAAEPTGMSMTGGTRYLVTGVSADVVGDGDSYLDRDTYLVTTDATTNQLSFRIAASSGNAVLDYFVFPVGSTYPLTETSYATQTMATLAVQPSSSYWVWVGAESGATSLPSDYGVTLCAETFVATPVP
jgi:hypothetical protein